jgi:hypothetical protein
MLEQLLNLVKEHATESVINNPSIPNEKNQEVVADATHSIFSGLQNVIAGGGLQSVLGLLGGNNNATTNTAGLMSNPIVQMIAGGLIKKLIGNHGLTPQAANGVASNLIPNVLSSLVSRTNNANDSSFDLAGIIGSLAGGGNTAGGGIGQLIQQFTGGGNAAGGGSNIVSSLLDQFTGGAQSNMQQQQASGGITGLLKQLIGG